MLAGVSAQVQMSWLAGEAGLGDAIALRGRVFCDEQGVPRELEVDGRDGAAWHLLARAEPGGPLVGTLRLLLEERLAKVGRVAVSAEYRRRGIALAMLALALERARELGADRARLAAQTRATELYRRAGFAVESEPFIEAGIEHVWMGRDL